MSLALYICCNTGVSVAMVGRNIYIVFCLFVFKSLIDTTMSIALYIYCNYGMSLAMVGLESLTVL